MMGQLSTQIVHIIIYYIYFWVFFWHTRIFYRLNCIYDLSCNLSIYVTPWLNYLIILRKMGVQSVLLSPTRWSPALAGPLLFWLCTHSKVHIDVKVLHMMYRTNPVYYTIHIFPIVKTPNYLFNSKTIAEKWYQLQCIVGHLADDFVHWLPKLKFVNFIVYAQILYQVLVDKDAINSFEDIRI